MNRTPNTKPLLLAGSVLAALVLVGGGYWLGTRHAPVEATLATLPAGEPQPLYWYDPMYPDKHFDKPGPSPFMDMELVAKYPNAGQDNTDGVRVSAASLQNLGVRTAVVEFGILSSGARVPGSIAWDQRASYAVSARTDGVIEKLHVRAPFEQVRKGQPLAELIAPEWNAAAQEYLALGQAGSADARALQGAARTRLRALGMDDNQIRSLRGSNPRVVLRAQQDGVVSQLDIREGQRVQAGMSLMTINGLATVWVEAAIPQAQAASIVPGAQVTASVSAFPGEVFDGKVEALLPNVDAGNRTQMARIVLANPGQRLAPGMFADLQFAGAAGESHPLLPDEALIATGSEARVIVALGEGRFRPVRVTTGRSAGGRTEILSGLSGGEKVVVSGQFLLDSEASLSGALERLSTDARLSADPHAGHDMIAMPAKPTPPTKAAEPDPHAGHDMRAMPAKPAPPTKAAEPDPHAGHDMSAMPAQSTPPAKTIEPDPHAGHDMGAMQPDPQS